MTRKKRYSAEFKRVALRRANEVAKRLQQLRRVGPIVAIALVATIGDGVMARSTVSVDRWPLRWG